MTHNSMRKVQQMSIKSPTTVYFVSRNRFIMMRDLFPRWYWIFLPIYCITIFPITIIIYCLKRRFNLLPSLFKGVKSGLITSLKKDYKPYVQP